MSDRVEQARRELVDAHRRETRDPAHKARGLAELLEAAERPPAVAPRSSALPFIIVGALLVVGAGAVVVTKTSEPAVTPPSEPRVVPRSIAPTEPASDAEQSSVPTAPVAKEPSPSNEIPTEPARPPVEKKKALPRPVLTVPDDPDTLARELALIDRARAQRRTEPASALSTLAQYDAEFPHGALGQEAALVRIEVLLALGRRTEAEDAAKSLVAKDRGGVLKKRVEALLGRPSGG